MIEQSMKNLPVSVMKMRYIIPFKPSGAPGAMRDIMLLIAGKKDKYGGIWIRDDIKKGEHDIYNHVLDMFGDDSTVGNSGIGASFTYLSDRRELVQLKYKDYNFNIVKAGMYLFSGGVGFFWYEIDELQSKDSHSISAYQLIEFQTDFKELNFRKNISTFKLRNNSEDFTVGDWAANMIASACGKIDFFAERSNVLYDGTKQHPRRVPDKALIFNYILYEADNVNSNISYYLTKGYKLTYRKPDNIEDKMILPFNNIIWYACREGAGYYVYCDEKNKTFLTRDMPHRFMSEYFLIYMLILNSAYTVISFSERIGHELPSDARSYMSPDMYIDMLGIMPKKKKAIYELEAKITALITEINVFAAKNVYSSVSYVEHQNTFFEYLMEVYKTEKSISSLLSGVGALRDILNSIIRNEQLENDGLEHMKWQNERKIANLETEKRLLQEEIYKDELTGLYNQKGYIRFSQEMYDEAVGKNRYLLVCSADMNGLKHINDECGGHEAGDNALKGVADMLKTAASSGDKVFRKGGDEFVILGIRDTFDGEADKLSQALEKAMIDINRDSGLPYRMAVSYGTVVKKVKDSRETLEDMFKEADDLMYDMKINRDKYRRQ